MIDAILDAFEGALGFLHDVFEPFFGVHSWGWAIIALTLVVRVALLPLAIKQTRSMRAMQALQPQLKELQKKYKVDRELMRKDPEQYRAKRAKLNEEMMALYQREGVNPAASCLPLLAQAPIFIALFYTLRRSEDLPGATFYFFTGSVAEDATAQGLAAVVSQAGWPGWLLIVLMSGTMFISQKQMMARTAKTQGADVNPMMQQQKILLYVMPLFLAVISFQFPLGILLYWVTTNAWQVVQQWIILREVQHEVEEGTIADKPGGGAASGRSKRRRRGPQVAPDAGEEPRRISPGASSGRTPITPPEGSTDGASTPPVGPEETGRRRRKKGRDTGAPSGPAAGTPPAAGAGGQAADGPGDGADGSGTGESGPGESGPGESGPGEDRPGERGPGEDRPGERGPGEDRPGRNGARPDAAQVDGHDPEPKAPKRTRDHLPRRRGGPEQG